MTEFGESYASAYDSLYAEKDYAAECALIDRLFREHAKGPIRTVLDLGCGTGNHVFPLCQSGYEVLGVDRSEEMLARARSKVDPAAKGAPRFEAADIRALELNQTFDGALMMFAVLGYQLENNDVLAALKTARRHMRTGGVFLFDVWYGPAVLHERPSERVKVIPTDKGEVLRVAKGEIDSEAQQCTIRYQLWELENDRPARRATEVHRMRYFFRLELELYLDLAGFQLLELKRFPEFDRTPDETTWNVLGVARAV